MNKNRLPPTEPDEGLDAYLETVFQKLGQNVEAPKELEKDVFDSLDAIHLLADFLDLFTIKLAQTELEILDLNPKDSEKNAEK